MRILVFLTILTASSAYALDAPKISARRKDATSSTVSWTFTRARSPNIEIQRGDATSSYKTIAIVKRTTSGRRFTDKKITSDAFRYRARLVVGRTRSRWSKVVTVPSGTTAPTPAPTSPSQGGNFDSAGNVTAAGKTQFRIPSNLSANIGRGRDGWFSGCRECHSVEKTGRDFVNLKTVLPRSPMFINLSDGAVADLTAYLNRFSQ